MPTAKLHLLEQLERGPKGLPWCPGTPLASAAASPGSYRRSSALIFMAALAGKRLTLYVLQFSLN